MKDDLVVIASYGYRHEAEFAQGLLESAGIESVLLADDAGGAEMGLTFSNAARLMVGESEVERARSVLGLEDEGS